MSEENKTEQDKIIESEQKYLREKDRANRFQGELTDSEKKIESYSKYGDPETIAQKLQELENLKKNEAGHNPEKLDKLINDKLEEQRLQAQKAIQEREDKINQLSSQLHETNVVSKAWDEIGNDFTTDAGKLLKNIIREKLTLTENNQIAVKGKDGKPEYIDGVKLKTVKDLALELKTEYPSLVADKSISGNLKRGIVKTDTNNNFNFEDLKSMSREDRRSHAGALALKELEK